MALPFSMHPWSLSFSIIGSPIFLYFSFAPLSAGAQVYVAVKPNLSGNEPLVAFLVTFLFKTPRHK